MKNLVSLFRAETLRIHAESSGNHSPPPFLRKLRIPVSAIRKRNNFLIFSHAEMRKSGNAFLDQASPIFFIIF